MAMHLQHMLKSAGHQLPETKPILEINPDHPLVTRLQAESDESRFNDWSQVLFDQALLAAGGRLDDPAAFVARLNDLFLRLTA